MLLESALRVDFGDVGQVAALVQRLRAHPALLSEIREAGLANSARFPLSATATALRELSASLAA